MYKGLRVYPIAVFLSEALGAPVIESLRLCEMWTRRTIPDPLEKHFGPLYFAFLHGKALVGFWALLPHFHLVSSLLSLPWKVVSDYSCLK